MSQDSSCCKRYKRSLSKTRQALPQDPRVQKLLQYKAVQGLHLLLPELCFSQQGLFLLISFCSHPFHWKISFWKSISFVKSGKTVPNKTLTGLSSVADLSWRLWHRVEDKNVLMEGLGQWLPTCAWVRAGGESRNGCQGSGDALVMGPHLIKFSMVLMGWGCCKMA